MIVRAEGTEDHEAIAAVVQAAFGSTDEARLVEGFRASAGYVPELALVAEDDGEVVGHIMVTLTELVDGTSILMLSPLAVRPDRQRTGIGTALVREGLRVSAERSEPLVIVEGDPRYYARFGFVAASELGLERPYETIPEAAFQALRLPAYVGAGVRPRGLPPAALALLRDLVTVCYLTSETPARRLGRGRASAAARSSATSARAISRAGFRRNLRIRSTNISCSSADRPILCRQDPRLHLEK